MTKSSNKLTAQQQNDLLETLQARFEKHAKRHKGLAWDDVAERLKKHPQKLWSLHEMERTGGEPDVIGHDKKSGEILFCDCSAESPDRRSLCYDREALDSRKENKPAGSAMEMAEEMGIELLNEEQYRDLQKLGAFDLKTSSWLATPPEIRKLGGAIYGDRRYDRVLVFHNGASSYYAALGFRGLLKV